MDEEALMFMVSLFNDLPTTTEIVQSQRACFSSQTHNFVNWVEIVFRSQQSIGSLTDGIYTVRLKKISQPRMTRKFFFITGY